MDTDNFIEMVRLANIVLEPKSLPYQVTEAKEMMRDVQVKDHKANFVLMSMFNGWDKDGASA